MMTTRKQHEWDVTLQSDTGQTIQRRFRSYWDPEHEVVTGESVARAAAAMEFTASNKQHQFAGIAAHLVTGEHQHERAAA